MIEGCSEGGGGCDLPLSLHRLADLYVTMRDPGARHRRMNCFDPRHHPLHRTVDQALFHQAADPVGVADHDVIPVGVSAVGNSRYLQHGAPPLGSHMARILTEGSFGFTLPLNDISLNDHFGVGRNQEFFPQRL